MPKPMGKGQNDLLFDAPSFYSQPVSASISFQIIPQRVCQKSKK